MTSEVVRNLVMLECVFYASVFNDLLLYKQAFLLQKNQQDLASGRDSANEESKMNSRRDSGNGTGQV